LEGFYVHKRWDRKMKRLFNKAPEDIIKWLFPGAEYQRVVSSELEGEPIFADHLEVCYARRYLDGNPSVSGD
jgi:hypothetical protein